MMKSTVVTSRVLTVLRVLPVTVLLAGALSFAPGAGAEAADSDGDGLFDQDELSYYLTDPNVADTDGDDLSDGDEVYYGTDPLVANAAPVRADTDGDGLYDDDEQSVYRTDPAVADTDGDGASDGNEVHAGTDPRLGATVDPAAPAPADPAPAPAPVPGGDDGFTPDLAVIIPGAIGVADLVDGDGDGLSDGDEERRGTNPTSFDTDKDGLRDGEEVVTYGTNPLAWDSNGNGISDWEDLAAGTAASTGSDPAPAPANEPPANEPVEPVAPPVSAADQDKILNGNGTTACEIEGACGNGVSPDPHCFQGQFRDDARLSADC